MLGFSSRCVQECDGVSRWKFGVSRELWIINLKSATIPRCTDVCLCYEESVVGYLWFERVEGNGTREFQLRHTTLSLISDRRKNDEKNWPPSPPAANIVPGRTKVRALEFSARTFLWARSGYWAGRYRYIFACVRDTFDPEKD